MGPLRWLARLAALAVAGAAVAGQPAPDRVLRGTLTRADHQTWREIPFDVPRDVDRLTVTFAYGGRDQHTTVDLGVLDPGGFRGWSGGNKAGFTLSARDATPSYLPGPIAPGRWLLLLGVANLRPGVRSDYVAEIRFGHGEAAAAAPLQSGPAWYRGDLHTHSAHSDATCASQSGVMVPCPVFRTLEAAAARGLDFVVVSDHNTVSQDQELLALQPLFDRLLLIPGEEVTTFHGHLGVIGAAGWTDFRLGGPTVPDVAALLDAVGRTGGLAIINHPALPSGEACLGCGWTAAGTPFPRIAGIEVVNGGVADGPLSGLAFWEGRLNAGDRLAAVGGSDNHRPDAAPDAFAAVGRPTTVVWAQALSRPEILAAISAGHVFIDVEGTRDRVLELTSGGARMGDVLDTCGPVSGFDAHVAGAPGALWRVIADGRPASPVGGPAEGRVGGPDARWSFTLPTAGVRWVRLEARTADGRRALLIGNPIYLRRPVGCAG